MRYTSFSSEKVTRPAEPTIPVLMSHPPPKFLYFKRFSFIPFAPVAEVTVQQSEGVYELSASPTTDEYQLSANLGIPVFVGVAPIKLRKGGVVSKRVYAYPQRARNLTTGEEIPLLTFSTPSPIFGPRVLKLNKNLQPLDLNTTHETSEQP